MRKQEGMFDKGQTVCFPVVGYLAFKGAISFSKRLLKELAFSERPLQELIFSKRIKLSQNDH